MGPWVLRGDRLSVGLGIFVPPDAAEPMRLKITFQQCACRYAVIGAAFFCPACGHNAADHVFVQSITGIGNMLGALPSIQAAIADRDVAEDMVRQSIENGLQNAVTSFQRYAEALYSRFTTAPAARRNAFQNSRDGSSLWQGVTGKGYTNAGFGGAASTRRCRGDQCVRGTPSIERKHSAIVPGVLTIELKCFKVFRDARWLLRESHRS